MATEPARRVRQSQMEIGRTPPAGLVMQTRRAHPSRLATERRAWGDLKTPAQDLAKKIALVKITGQKQDV